VDQISSMNKLRVNINLTEVETYLIVRTVRHGANVRFGSKADICSAKRHVRFTPNSDRESGHEISEPEILSVGIAIAPAFDFGVWQGAGGPRTDAPRGHFC
jgi:hypothetical protein